MACSTPPSAMPQGYTRFATVRTVIFAIPGKLDFTLILYSPFRIQKSIIYTLL
jgi:hypothetical protein